MVISGDNLFASKSYVAWTLFCWESSPPWKISIREIPRMLPLVAQQLSEIQAPHKLYAKVGTWSRGGVFWKAPPPKKKMFKDKRTEV